RVLLDADPGVIEAAVRSLMAQVPSLPPARLEALTEQLLHLATDRKTPLSPDSATAVGRLLGALDDPRGGPLPWDRILPPHPTAVRAAALRSLGKWVASPGKDQLKRLFLCAADADFQVATPALVILDRLPPDDRAVPEWLALLQAPDVGVRLV